MVFAINASETNRSKITYIAETQFGVTPATGLAKALRITQSNIVAKKGTKSSQEIRADRMVPGIIETDASSSGDVDGEFSAGTHDDFMEAFLLGTWSKAMNSFIVRGQSASIPTTSTVVLSGGDYTAFLVNGRFFKLEGFAALTNNGYFAIVSSAFAAGDTTVTVAGTPFTIETGKAAGKFIDAGDVISVATTTTLTNPTGGSAINFVAATTAGLQVGQRLHLSGLGKETATIQALATDPAEGTLITVSDSVTTLVFEIRTVAGLVGSGNIWIALSGTPATLAASIADAINTKFNDKSFQVYATAVTDTVTLRNGRSVGATVTTSDLLTSLALTAFTGGDAAKSGFVSIKSIPSTTQVIVNEILTTDANAGSLTVVVKGSHVRNPGVPTAIVKRSFSIQTGFTDVSKYFLVNGMRVSMFDMNLNAGDITKLKFGFHGLETTNGSVDTLGSAPYTFLDGVGTEITNATSNVGNIYANGVGLSTAIMDIQFKGDNKVRDQKAVGHKFPVGIAYGHFELKGSFKAYFTDLVLYNRFLNHETVSLAFPIMDADSNTYWFSIPAIKLTSDPVSPTGMDQDVMDNVAWEAFRDPILKTQMMIDRFSSLFPSSVA
jgi:hypothetical protein